MVDMSGFSGIIALVLLTSTAGAAALAHHSKTACTYEIQSLRAIYKHLVPCPDLKCYDALGSYVS